MPGRRWQFLAFDPPEVPPPGFWHFAPGVPDDVTVIGLVLHSNHFPLAPMPGPLPTILPAIGREDVALDDDASADPPAWEQFDRLWPHHAPAGALDCLCSRCLAWIDEGDLVVHVPEPRDGRPAVPGDDTPERRYCRACLA